MKVPVTAIASPVKAGKGSVRRAEVVAILAGAVADLALKRPPVAACGADRPKILASGG